MRGICRQGGRQRRPGRHGGRRLLIAACPEGTKLCRAGPGGRSGGQEARSGAHGGKGGGSAPRQEAGRCRRPATPPQGLGQHGVLQRQLSFAPQGRRARCEPRRHGCRLPYRGAAARQGGGCLASVAKQEGDGVQISKELRCKRGVTVRQLLSAGLRVVVKRL